MQTVDQIEDDIPDEALEAAGMEVAPSQSRRFLPSTAETRQKVGVPSVPGVGRYPSAIGAARICCASAALCETSAARFSSRNDMRA